MLFSVTLNAKTQDAKAQQPQAQQQVPANKPVPNALGQVTGQVINVSA